MFGINKMLIKATKVMILNHKKEVERHLNNISFFGEGYKQSLAYQSSELRIALLDLKINILKGILNI